MKGTITLLFILFFLVMAYMLWGPNRSYSSLAKDDISFAIEDTSLVDKIRMVRYVQGNAEDKILLQRKMQDWELNNMYPAFQPQVDLLLHTFSNLHVREVLIEGGKTTGLELIEQQHILIEVWAKGKLLKSYQLGRQGKDGLGSVMKLTHSETPFIVEIPGFQGYLNTRFSLNENFWRENLLFDLDLSSISSINIAYPKLSQGPFVLKKEKETWKISGAQTNQGLLQEYLSLFKGSIYGESFAEKTYPGAMTELRKSLPDRTKELVYVDRKTRKLILYERGEAMGNYFGWIEGEDTFITVQKYVIDPFFQGFNELLK